MKLTPENIRSVLRMWDDFPVDQDPRPPDQVLRRFTKGGGPKHPVYLAWR